VFLCQPTIPFDLSFSRLSSPPPNCIKEPYSEPYMWNLAVIGQRQHFVTMKPLNNSRNLEPGPKGILRSNAVDVAELTVNNVTSLYSCVRTFTVCPEK
jgi:hypothetical protein